MTEYRFAKQRGDTRGMHAAQGEAFLATTKALARHVFGRTKAKRVMAAVNAGEAQKRERRRG